MLLDRNNFNKNQDLSLTTDIESSNPGNAYTSNNANSIDAIVKNKKSKKPKISLEIYKPIHDQLISLNYSDQQIKDISIIAKSKRIFIFLIENHTILIKNFNHAEIVHIAEKAGLSALQAITNYNNLIGASPNQFTKDEIIKIVGSHGGAKNLKAINDNLDLIGDGPNKFTKHEIIRIVSHNGGANNLSAIKDNLNLIGDGPNKFSKQEITRIVSHDGGANNLRAIKDNLDLIGDGLNKFTKHEIIRIVSHGGGANNLRAIKDNLDLIGDGLNKFTKHEIIRIVSHIGGANNLRAIKENLDLIGDGPNKFPKQEIIRIVSHGGGANNLSAIKGNLDLIGDGPQQFTKDEIIRIVNHDGGTNNLKAVKENLNLIGDGAQQFTKQEIVRIVSNTGGSHNLKAVKDNLDLIGDGPQQFTKDEIIRIVSHGGGSNNLSAIKGNLDLIGDGPQQFTKDEIIRIVHNDGGANNLKAVKENLNLITAYSAKFSKSQIVRIVNYGGAQHLKTFFACIMLLLNEDSDKVINILSKPDKASRNKLEKLVHELENEDTNLNLHMPPIDSINLYSVELDRLFEVFDCNNLDNHANETEKLPGSDIEIEERPTKRYRKNNHKISSPIDLTFLPYPIDENFTIQKIKFDAEKGQQIKKLRIKGIKCRKVKKKEEYEFAITDLEAYKNWYFNNVSVSSSSVAINENTTENPINMNEITEESSYNNPDEEISMDTFNFADTVWSPSFFASVREMDPVESSENLTDLSASEMKILLNSPAFDAVPEDEMEPIITQQNKPH